VILTLLLPAAATARDPEESWLRVTATVPRTTIRVRTFDGTTRHGLFEKGGPDELRFTVDGRETVIARLDIARVEIYTPSRRVRNLLIGAAIGVGAGLAGAFITCPTCEGEQSTEDYQRRQVVAALGGAAVGAAVSRLVAPYRSIYKAKRLRR